MSSFSLWAGLGEPGEACVEWGGKETTLGAQCLHEGGFAKKERNG
jgi:hypothetical protein